MSTVIDERIVQMQFDNKDFEKNVSTTMDTLKNLDNNIKNLDNTTGLQNLSNSASRINLTPLETGVEAIKDKFSAMSIVAITALQNITNKAIDAGEKIVKSLTIDPIATGFSEYELKMDSVQTILNSARLNGEAVNLEIVSKYLEELNKYADDTIYSFKDMTNSIGKFTNAGVDLDVAVQAIKGISNEAAVSGASATEASRAMYNIAQALSTGSMKLMDWKSIENANMATIGFKQTLIDTAKEMGVLQDAWEGGWGIGKDIESFEDITAEKFRASIEGVEGQTWVTNEVLLNALQKYSDKTTEFGQKAYAAAQDIKTFSQMINVLQEAAQSGWSESMEIIFGNFEEAKNLWTQVGEAISGVLDKQAEERNKILKDWKEAGGRDAIMEAFGNAWKGLLSVIKPIQEAFREIFPPITGERIAEISKNILELTKRFQLSDETTKNLKNTFKGLFAILDIIKQAFSALFNVEKTFLSFLPGISGGILGITGSLGEWIVKLDETIKQNNIFTKSAEFLINIIKDMPDAFKSALSAISDFGQLFSDTFQNLTGKTIEEAVDIGKNLVVGIATGIKDFSILVFNAVIDFGKSVINKIKEIFGIHSPSTEWYNIAYNCVQGFILGFVEAIPAAIKIVAQNISDLFTSAKNAIIGGRGSVEEGLETFRSANTSALDDFLNAVKDKLSGLTVIFAAIKNGIQVVWNAMTAFFKDAYNTRQLRGHATEALGVGIIFVTVKKVKKAIEYIKEAVDSIVTIFGDIKGTIKSAGNTINGTLGEIKNTLVTYQKDLKADMLLKIAEAVGILALSMLVLSTIDSEKIKSAGIAIAELFGGLIIEMGGLTGAGKLGKDLDQLALYEFASTLIKVSAAVLVLSIALQKIAEIDSQKLADANGSLLLIVGEIVTAGIALSKWGGKIQTSGLAMIEMAAAITILTLAVKILSTIESDKLQSAALAIGELCVSIGVMALMSSKFKASNGLAILEVSAALLVLSGVVAIFGTIPVDKLSQGVIAIGILAVEIGTLGLMAQKFKASNGLAILELATALGMLAGVVYIFGKMDVNTLTQGEIAVGILGGIIGVTSLLSSKIGPGSGLGLIALATALIIMSGAIAMLGALPFEIVKQGLITIGLAIGGLAVAGLALSPALPFMAALTGILMGMSAAMLMFGVGVSALAAGLAILSVSSVVGATALASSLDILLVGFFTALNDSIWAVKEVVKSLIYAVIDVLVTSAVDIAEGAMQLIVEVLKQLNNYGPQIIDQLFDFLIMLFTKLAERTPEFVDVVFNFLKTLFESIINKLQELDPNFVVDAIAAIGFIETLMLALASMAILAAPAMVGVLALAGVITELTAVLALFGALAQIPGLMWIIGEGGTFLKAIGTALGDFLGGLAGAVLEGIMETLIKFGDDLNKFIDPFSKFMESVKQLDAESANALSVLVDSILKITANEILSGLTSWITGGSSIVKFGEELEEFGPHLKAYADSIQGLDSAAIEASASAVKILADMAKDLPKHDGLAQKIFGETSLADFGKELETFGPHIKQYGEDVKGLDSKAIETSAAAATILSDMAKKLPKHDGLAQKIFGDNTLTDFGKELETFGPHIKQYGEDVNGLNTGAVGASAAAASILSTMASNLPKHSGVVQWFTGDNKLSDFGEELEEFGPYMKAYGESISGLNTGAVLASTMAIQMLSDLASGLQNHGGLVSLFKGDNKLEDFGKEIKKFGKQIKEYGEEIDKINIPQLTLATIEFKALAEMVSTISRSDTSGLLEFSSNLKAFAQNGLDDFIKVFVDAGPKLKDAMNAFTNTVKTMLSPLEFQEVGTQTMTALVMGMEIGIVKVLPAIKMMGMQITKSFNESLESKKFSQIGQNDMTSLTVAYTAGSASLILAIKMITSNILKSFKELNKDSKDISNEIIKDLLNIIKSNINHFESITKDLMMSIRNGISSSSNEIVREMRDIFKEIEMVIRDYRDEFKYSGEDFVYGFADGVRHRRYEAIRAVRDLAYDILDEFRETLDEHSPSRITDKFGRFFDEGFINGLEALKTKTTRTAAGIGEAAVDAISDTMLDVANIVPDDLIEPTIKPVIDLTNVQDGSSRISQMLDTSGTIKMAADISSYNYQNIGELVKEMTNAIAEDNNSDVISAIDTLNTNMTNVMRTLGQLQVVLDTGTLVGELVNPLDNSMGFNQMLIQRGVRR